MLELAAIRLFIPEASKSSAPSIVLLDTRSVKKEDEETYFLFESSSGIVPRVRFAGQPPFTYVSIPSFDAYKNKPCRENGGRAAPLRDCP